MRALTLIAIALAVPASARADVDRCDPHSPNGGDRETPLLGKLRWDLAIGALEVARGGTYGGELMGGVTKLVDSSYVLNFDLGLRATLGVSPMSPSKIDGLTEVEARWYPIKLGQTSGIDECGCHTKTRRWSNSQNGVGYLLLLAGYGHQREADAGSRDALTGSVGIGYEHNLTDDTSPCQDPNLDLTTPKGANRRSIFAQGGYRFDLVGSGDDQVKRLGGWFVEAGIRF